MYEDVLGTTALKKSLPGKAKKNLRRIGTLAFAATIAVAIAACSSPSAAPSADPGASGGPMTMASLEKAAKAEGGHLVWYTTTVDAGDKALAADFQKKYGITVEYQRLATGPLLDRFTKEQKSGGTLADVLEPASPQIFADDPEWFADITDVPNYEAYPKGDKEAKYIAVSLSPFTLTYNTNLVAEKDVPKTWADLVNPKWKGKVLLTDVRSSPVWMWWAKRMDDTQGKDFLKKVAALQPQLADSASAAAAQVAAGAKALSFPATAGNAADLIKQGAPLKTVEFQKDTSGSAIYAAVVENAPHPNTARLFLAYRMTAGANKILCDSAQSAVPLTAKSCPALPPGWASPEIVDQKSATALLKALGIS